jgi:thioredoxin reductase (NADPH)
LLKFISQENHMSDEKLVKVLILGSGPAGLAAALYAARAELNPVVLTGMQLGGQAALTHTIENYPGFPEGVGGSQLGELFQAQAERFGAKVEFDMAHEVDFSRRPYTVKTDSGVYKAETLIISTGASSIRLGIPGEVEKDRWISWARLARRGVSGTYPRPARSRTGGGSRR